jgi:hypothetical protein
MKNTLLKKCKYIFHRENQASLVFQDFTGKINMIKKTYANFWSPTANANSALLPYNNFFIPADLMFKIQNLPNVL